MILDLFDIKGMERKLQEKEREISYYRRENRELRREADGYRRENEELRRRLAELERNGHDNPPPTA